MLFLVAGLFKEGVEQRLMDLRNEVNELLSQPSPKISLAGVLRDKDRRRVGYLTLIEADDFEGAETFLNRSPFYQNDLYEQVQVAEFNPEIGKVEA